MSHECWFCRLIFDFNISIYCSRFRHSLRESLNFDSLLWVTSIVGFNFLTKICFDFSFGINFLFGRFCLKHWMGSHLTTLRYADNWGSNLAKRIVFVKSLLIFPSVVDGRLLVLWLLMQVICAQYSDEKFFRIRCKGILFSLCQNRQRIIHVNLLICYSNVGL